MKEKERSRKSKEAIADSQMKVATSLFSAFFIAILIAPLGVIIQSFVSPSEAAYHPFKIGFNWPFIIKTWIFLLCEMGVYSLASHLRTTALNTYDELYPDTSSSENSL